MVTTYVEKNSSAARVIFINATTDATVSGSSDDIVFIKGSGTGSSYDSKLGTYYEYDAIINGEFTTIKTVDQFKTSGLYNIVSYDKNGVATNLGKDSNVKTGTGTVRVKNDVVGLADSYYTYSKDCQVFHIDEDGDIDETVYTVSNIATDKNDTVWFAMDSGDVVAIVYQDMPDDKTPDIDFDSDYVTRATVDEDAGKITVKALASASDKRSAVIEALQAAGYTDIQVNGLSSASGKKDGIGNSFTISVVIAEEITYTNLSGGTWEFKGPKYAATGDTITVQLSHPDWTQDGRTFVFSGLNTETKTGTGSSSKSVSFELTLGTVDSSNKELKVTIS